MSLRQPRSEPSVLSPASQLPVSTQNDSSSPSYPHGLFFRVPKGARVRANASAKAQHCPSTGTAKGRWAEERLGGKYPSKAAQREGEASPEIFRAKHYPPYPPATCSSPCSDATGARAQKKKKVLLSGKNWALSPQIDCGTSGAIGRWVLKDVKRCGGMQVGCKAMQRDAEGCMGMHSAGRLHGELPIDALPPVAHSKGRV